MDKTGYLQPAAKAGLALLIALAMIFAGLVITGEPAFAQTTEDGWSYEDAGDGTLRITDYEGEETDLVVPAKIGEKAVTQIGDGALAGKPKLCRITVSEGITAIGQEAFADCPSLEEVALPDTVTSIGSRAFRWCGKLSRCTLPKNLQEFPYQCFWDCRSLTEITIPDGVTTIPNGAFYNNWNLAKATIPGSVTTIEKNAFHACLILYEVRLSENVVSIDPDAFSDCEGLEIIAPEGSCANIFAKENGYGPETAILESAHPYPYEDQQWSYTHPEDAAALKVTFSPKTRFSEGGDRFTITDGENIDFIYRRDQLAAETLVLAGNSFTMSLSVLTKGKDCFGFRITDIKPMTAEEYQAYLDDLNAHPWMTRVVNGTLQITGYRGRITTVDIPAQINGVAVASIANSAFIDNNILQCVRMEGNVRSIGNNAFRRCRNLEEVELPDSVTEINSYAFQDCTKLEKITLPKGLASLREGTFRNCEALENLMLPAGLEEIGQYAFEGAGLTSLEIPPAVHTIGTGAFDLCRNLTELTVNSGNRHFSARDSIIYNKSGKRLVCCAGGLSGVITVPDGVKEISDNAFSYISGITKVILPDGVAKMGESVFFSCESLEEVILPETITVLPEETFVFCESLTKVHLPASLKEIREYAFEGCISLTEMLLPASLKEIQEYAFEGCDNLKRIYVPDSVSVIDDNAFCFSEKVVICASAGSYAFRWAQEQGVKALDVPLAKAGQYADKSAKELIIAGKATGGRLVYALGTGADKAPAASSYSEAIPTGTDAGTYYVWYKMTEAAGGDEADEAGPQDLTDPECIQVEILGDADRVEEKINALPAKIALKDKPAVDDAVAAWQRLSEKEKASLSANAVRKLATADDAIYCRIAADRGTKIKSAKRKKGGKARVKWNKSPGASGYRIIYSTSRKFKKNVKTKSASASATKATLKKIRKGKKYYVQVTPYTDVRNRVTGVTKQICGHKSKTKKL